MYLYDEIDQKLVDERVAQFRDQTRRFLAGKLSTMNFARCACGTALHPALRADAPHRDPVRVVVDEGEHLRDCDIHSGGTGTADVLDRVAVIGAVIFYMKPKPKRVHASRVSEA